jgi:hypothetical protein
MSTAPKPPSTKPPPSVFALTSEKEMHIAAATRATTVMRELPPLKSRPRLAMDPEAIAWVELSEAALTLVDRLDGKATVMDLAEGTDAEVDAVFDAIHELQAAGVIVFDS